MATHPVVTKDYTENQVNGILICGINFGFSKADEEQEKQDHPPTVEPKSFFSDLAVNRTGFRATVLKWLSSWGLEFATQAGEEGEFERSFFQTNWLDTQTRSVSSDGKITIDTLVMGSDGFLNLLEERRPAVILFFGVELIEAFNDIRIRDRVTSILGDRSGNPKNLTADLPNYKGKKFKMRVQYFGGTTIISMVHPVTAVSDAYIAALKPPQDVLAKIRGV